MNPLDYLQELQVSKKTQHGFNSELQIWVDDNSSAARVLRALAEHKPAALPKLPRMPWHVSPIPPNPRWWQHASWKVKDFCSHRDIKVTRSSTLTVNGTYEIEAFSGRCRTCAAHLHWSKRHKPIWFIRAIRKVHVPWTP